MPLLRRQPFVKQKPQPDLALDDEVFHCTLTNEIFQDYNEFFERIILCNSLVWTCALTGRSGLTYQEALDCEEKAKKRLSSFPDYIQKPILFLVTLTHRSRLNDLNDDVFVFMRDRYFIGEVVEVTFDGEKKSCRIQRVLPLGASDKPKLNGTTPITVDTDSDSDVICLDDLPPEDKQEEIKKSPPKDHEKSAAFGADPSTYQYVVQELKKGHTYTVKAGQINRKKGLHTRDKSKLYLKQHCDSLGDGIWKVKEKFVKKFKLNELRFSDIYNGPLPNFKQSVAKKIPKDKTKKLQKEKVKKEKGEESGSGVKRGRPKKGEESPSKKKNREMGLPDVETLSKMTTEERLALKAKLKEEKRLAKLAEKEKLKEQFEAEKAKMKEQRLAEKEKQKEEKALQEAILKEWNRPREDMELDDLQDLPVPEPVKLNVQADLFGDMVMILEYMYCFNALFDVKDQFPEEITLQMLCTAVTSTESSGLYFDLLKFLLLAIFNLQQEEHDEEEELQKSQGLVESLTNTSSSMSRQDFVKKANAAAQIPLHNYSCSLNKLQLDCLTISEILRLHFMGSGAELNVEDAKFCYQERGGFTCLDDPGLEFCRQEPEVIHALATGSVFDLTTGDKLKVLTTLINQLLTFVACRDFMEDNFEKLLQVRRELRNHQLAEKKREQDEAAFWTKKRSEDRAKQRQIDADEKMEKMKAREERLRIEEVKKRAKAEGKDLKQLLKDEDHTDLLERLEKDAEKARLESERQNATPQNTAEETKPVEKEVEPVEPERRSERRKGKPKGQPEPEEEIPIDNIDWEKLMPAERKRWREIYERKEGQLHDTIAELQNTYQIIPLGRDRTFRRYWVFRHLPGLFIEDDDQDLPSDILTPIEQKITDSKSELSGTNPADLSGEAKSICSDKENQSPSSNKGITPKVKDEVIASEDAEVIVLDDKSRLLTQGVHEQCAQFGNVRWSYIKTAEQLDRLIDSLNTRGFREGPLKTTLKELRPRLVESIKSVPVDMLQMTDSGSAKVVKVQNIKSRNRVMAGVVENASSREFLELNLREMLLDLEDRIYAGSLGWIKINKRAAWRDAIENGSYDPQSDDIITSSQQWEEERMETDDDDADVTTVKESAVAHDLARALLQIKSAIDTKYLTQPLGTAVDATSRSRGQNKKTDKEAKKAEDDSDEDEDEGKMKLKPFAERWEESLLSSQSLSQVFLHLTVVERSVLWSKSALNARCRLCRRKGDADKMLLCDSCDRGHHMFCLKPAVKHVPKGNWYCPDCKPKEIMRTPRKVRRASTFREEESEEEEDSSDEEQAADSSDEEDEAGSDEGEEAADSDDSDDSDDDDSDSSSESGSEESDSSEEEGSPETDEDDDAGDSDDGSESGSPDSEEEQKKQPAKIKIGASAKKKKPASGRSSPVSGRSSRNTTRESTPVDKCPKARKRLSMNDHSEGPPAKKPARSRLSAETANKSTSRSRKSVENSNTRSRSESRKSQEPDDVGTKARGGQSANHMKLCEGLIEDLIEQDDSWPFVSPVTKKDAPDYFTIIKKPMDLGTIKCKINKYEYSDPASILEDIRLVFTNCERYNVPSAEEYVAGQRLCRYFVRRVRELKLDAVLSQKAAKVPNGVNGNDKGKKKSTPEVTGRRSRRSNP